MLQNMRMMNDIETLGAVVAVLPQIACIGNALGNIVCSNVPWRETFGGAGWQDAIHPDDLAAWNWSSDDLRVPCRMRSLTGEWNAYTLTLRHLVLPDNGSDLWLVTATPFEMGDNALRADVALLRRMVDASVDCIKVMSPEGKLRMMNRSGCVALGVPEEQVPGRDWLPLLPPEVRAPGEIALEQVRATHENQRFPGRSQLPGQDPMWWDNLLIPITDASGELSDIVCVSRDVSGVRSREEELKLAQERLEIAADAAGLGSFELFPREGVFRWDERCSKIMGRPEGRGESYSRDLLEAVHPDDRQATDAAIRNALQPDGPGTFRCEFRTGGCKAEGKERYIRASGMTLFEGRRPWRMIGTVQDVTEDHLIRAELREATEKLAEALEVEHLLTREMHHRIKNVFAVVTGLISIARRETRATDDVHATLADLRQRLFSMAKATDLVLRPAVGELPAGSFDPVALSNAILAPYKGRYMVHGCAGPHLPVQLLNPLVLILHELATNSLKYGAFGDPNGRVSVEWSHEGTQSVLTWTETGGAPIPDKTAGSGFGSVMLQDVVTMAGGELTLEWPREGLRATLRLND